ncbi:hypothetical protein OG963_17235 [Streptomyces sp. NBC_01707]|jgi:hypothetical protein|uniref:hypothetical protein n=1 Tax=Streptomyces sp. NBC_01707 TaxID=2975914 RepID=UPI00352FB567
MATISRSHRLRAQNSVRRLQRADLLGLGVQRADALNLRVSLGHEKGDETRAGPGNSRDDTSRKRALTDLGAAEIDLPRDRTGSWAVEPGIEFFGGLVGRAGNRSRERSTSQISAKTTRAYAKQDTL